MNHKTNIPRTPEEKQRIVQEVQRAKANGESVQSALKRLNVAFSLYYGWRKKMNGQPTGDAREIVQRNGDTEKQLRIENQRLKMIVADQALDIQALKEWRAR